MKKIQVSLPEPTAKELMSIMREKGYESESECGRHIIQDYLVLRRHGVIKEAPGGVPTEYSDLFTESSQNPCALA